MTRRETLPHATELQCRLMEARQDGSAALNRLLAVSCPYLLFVAEQEFSAVLRRRLCPADVVQETLLEAYRDFPQFQGETPADWLAWLRRILLHNLLNERRRHLDCAKRSAGREVSLREVPGLTGTDSPSARLGARESEEKLERALRQLSQRHQRVVVLHIWEGLTFAEVGTQLFCSAEAARKLWNRAAAKLARLLSEA